jgi:hypothetical protein
LPTSGPYSTYCVREKEHIDQHMGQSTWDRRSNEEEITKTSRRAAYLVGAEVVPRPGRQERGTHVGVFCSPLAGFIYPLCPSLLPLSGQPVLRSALLCPAAAECLSCTKPLREPWVGGGGGVTRAAVSVSVWFWSCALHRPGMALYMQTWLPRERPRACGTKQERGEEQGHVEDRPSRATGPAAAPNSCGVMASGSTARRKPDGIATVVASCRFLGLAREVNERGNWEVQ